MLPSIDFVRQSIDLHLFFARIMKEHSFFLEVGFTPRDAEFSRQADAFRMEFDSFLRDVVAVANGVVSPDVLQSGEVVTPYTLNAEKTTSFLAGIQIPTDITQAEIDLICGNKEIDPQLEQKVVVLNQRAIDLIGRIIQFKTTILSNVLSCKMFTINYPLLLDHILREAKLYLQMVQRLQNRERINVERDVLEQELFWNRIMAEHSKFIRGLLDPTENELIIIANNFGNEFDTLVEEVEEAMEMNIPLTEVTEDSLNATKRIRDFKAQGTQGLLGCNIQSIIIPLLGDHVLREASHFLRLLKTFYCHLN